jgi:hypothetical protein
MVGITTYIPKEFFNETVSLQILIGIGIILVLIFIIYKFYDFNGKKRKKPESF